MVVRHSKGGAVGTKTARRTRIVRRPPQTSTMTVLPYCKYDLSLRIEILFQNQIGVHGEPVFLVTKLGTTETVPVPGISDLFITSQ